MIIQGKVMRSTGSFYDIRAEDGTRYVCKVRGKVRLEGIRETNPVAVGDHVLFDNSSDIGVIKEILPRDNHMLRQSVKKTGHSHVLAANLDQALLVVTLAYPRTSLGFIDRFLVAAEAFRIPQVLVFNKKDLLEKEESLKQEETMDVYARTGVKCIAVSALADDLAHLLALLENKTTLFAGHSGVGKSTL
ncbi:MAG TPA: GTPase RsgA, partial [Chryseosolibacter sp.]|nr:GTPase RsgA [Chryseosolibacter sp.]